MTLADKIYDLRKRRGWSQEELSEKCDVSRQSVSKWESGQSVPDLSKILILSEVFQVSTDYLLKEEVSGDEFREAAQECSPGEGSVLRRVSSREAQDYLELTRRSAPRIAAGVFLCILSPALLIILSAFTQTESRVLSENMAVGTGAIVLFILIAIAVFIFVLEGSRLGRFEYLELEHFVLESDMERRAAEESDRFFVHFQKRVAVGVVFCIISAIPILIAGVLDADVLICCICLTVLLLLIAVGVYLIVEVSIIQGGYQKLLQQKDYSPENKKANKMAYKIAGIYWPCITAIYLAYSFLTGNWQISWIIWPLAGVVSAVVRGICLMIKK